LAFQTHRVQSALLFFIGHFLPFRDSFFVFVEELKTHLEAQQACQQRHARLAKVDDPGVQTFIEKIIVGSGNAAASV